MSDDCFLEELAHTADVGMRVRATTPAALFVCAARGLLAIAGAEPGPPTDRQRVTVEAADAESLLVAWLNELLYMYETTGLIAGAIQVLRWSPTLIEADLSVGPPLAPPRGAIKAVTYHRLQLAEEPDGWLAEYYVDV